MPAVESYMKENLDFFDFALTAEEISALSAIA
jgi:hypothetical protein